MKKRINLALAFGMICTVLLSMSHFNAACDDLRENVLRLHIIANSDSCDDQALKLEIRDAILEKSGDLFLNCDNLANAEKTVNENLDLFTEIANEVIKENGINYSARAAFGRSDFNTRYYDDFTLPAGEYNSLIITLGEGKGKNWWCVVYPTVCIPAATKGDLKETATDEACKISKGGQRYIMRFKTVEIYEKIKKLINK